MHKKPIIWTIAGSDCGGGAGIQADLHAIQALGGFGCSAITALTAQNSYTVNKIEVVSATMLQEQLAVLQDDLPAKALKLGMLANRDVMQVIAVFLQEYRGFIICDPVMLAGSGAHLLHHKDVAYLSKYILPLADIVTPNIPEAGILTNMDINTVSDVEVAALKLITMGCKSVLLKGGHSQDTQLCQDYWTDGERQLWLTQTRWDTSHTHGSGCTLSAALTTLLGHGYGLDDALVIAKMYTSQGIRLAEQYGEGPGPVQHSAWPMSQLDLPLLTDNASEVDDDYQFPDCGPEPLGIYPIVPSLEWLEKLIASGATTMQLRIKDKTGEALEQDIATAIALAKQHNVRLFINDFWQLAIKYAAYGVHLGQEDLQTCDFIALQESDLRLGISTHCYAEVARAHALNPSYMAIGPIYHTNSKPMKFGPQGIERLQEWCDMLEYPLVAIGGINAERIADVAATGVSGAAMISVITEADKPCEKVKRLQEIFYNSSGLRGESAVKY